MVLGCLRTQSPAQWSRIEAREQIALQSGSKTRSHHSPASFAELMVDWWIAASALGQSVGRPRSNVSKPLRRRRSLARQRRWQMRCLGYVDR